MFRHALAFVCALFFFQLNGGYEETWTSNGPGGSYLNLMGIASSNPDVLYLGTLGGVYKSVDAGLTWSRTATDLAVTAIHVSPDDPLTVYIGTIEGVYKTENGGSTWLPAGLSGAEINAIAIDPDHPQTVYVGTGKAYSQMDGEIVGVYKSTNGGEDWEQVLYADILDGIRIDSVAALLIDTTDSQTIYAGLVTTGSSYEDYGGLQRSQDGGETWENLQVYGHNHVEGLAMTPAGYQPATLYAGTYWEYRKSTNQGDSWETIYEPESPDYIMLKPPIVIDPNTPTQIYVTSYQGIYQSPDAGVNWVKFGGEVLPQQANSIVFDPRDSKVYVGPNQGCIYWSEDGGASWEISYATNTRIMDLAVDPVSSFSAYATIFGGAFHAAKTTNGGRAWDVLENSSTHLSAVAIDPQNPSTVYAGMGLTEGYYFRIYRSTNSGEDWTGITFLHCGPGECKTEVSDILVNPINSDHLLVATSNTDGILIRSRDGADTWDELDFSTTELDIDPNDPDIVYTVSSFYTDDYIYRYNDVWGDGWSKTDITPDEGIFLIHDIAVDKSSRLYVASYDGLWRYEESAWTHFNNLPAQDITSIDIDIHANPETIYIGANGEGVFLSQDGGATWNMMNEGLEVLSINVLEISASQPKILYAGTRYGGVWTIEPDSTAPEWKKIFVPTLFSGET